MRLFYRPKPLGTYFLLVMPAMLAGVAHGQDLGKPLTYRHFEVEEADGRVIRMTPVPAKSAPRWAREVSREPFDWTKQSGEQPFFAQPIPFVLPPTDEAEPFYPHNHQPSITWLPNGDLLAVWYSTNSEYGLVLTVLASRLRPGKQAWEPSSEFFKAPNRNMHGSSIFHDGHGTIYHFNGMAPHGVTGWKKLALLMRTSTDNGVTWTPPKAIDGRLIARHQVISGTLMTKGGVLIQACDAASGGSDDTALHISRDGGKTWPVRKLLTPGEGEFDGGAWTKQFTATPTRAEHAGYLAATQTPDGVIHLISSRLHYRFNLPWLVTGTSRAGAEPPRGPRTTMRASGSVN